MTIYFYLFHYTFILYSLCSRIQFPFPIFLTIDNKEIKLLLALLLYFALYLLSTAVGSS